MRTCRLPGEEAVGSSSKKEVGLKMGRDFLVERWKA